MTRITTTEVCALGRFSRATMWRRIAAGTLPTPIDQGREAIFERERVLAALSIPRPRWRARMGGKASAESRANSAGGPPISGKSLGRWTADRWNVAL